MPARPCRFAPRCRLDRFEFNARRIREAEQCAGPGCDRVIVSDIFADQHWQGVAVAEDELPFQGFHPRLEGERHPKLPYCPGDWQQRQLTDAAF